MVCRLLAGFVRLNLQFSVSWLVDFKWGSCGSIFSFVSWLVEFQWGSCGSIFCFLCHGWQTFSGVRVAQSLVFCFWQVDFSGVRVAQSSFLCHGWQTFSGVRVAQSLGFCFMVGRLLAGLVWLNLQFSVSWLVDFQWGSCCSIFSFVSWQVYFYWGSCGSIFSFLCHVRQTFSGVRVAQSLVFYVMVGRLLVGFVWLNLQFSVSWLVDFQWGSCGSIFSLLCHGRQTFSGVRVAQSLVLCHGWQTFSGVRVAQSLVLCHDRQTFSGVRVAQSLVLCVMVDRLLVGFVWFNLQFSVS